MNPIFTAIALTFASILSAAEVDGPRINVVPARTVYPVGALATAVIQIDNPTAEKLRVRCPWKFYPPAGFSGQGPVPEPREGEPLVASAIRFIRLGDSPTVDVNAGQPSELPPGGSELEIPALGKAQWLMPVPGVLDQPGERTIPWALPPIEFVRGATVSAAKVSGSLRISVLAARVINRAAGLAATADVASDAEGDHVAFTLQGDRTHPSTRMFEGNALFIVRDAAGAQRSVCMSAQQGLQLDAQGHLEWSQQLVPGMLVGGGFPAAGRATITVRWCDVLSDAPEVPDLALREWTAGAVPIPAGPSDWPLRDDRGVYPRRAGWLSCQAIVDVDLDVSGRMVGKPVVRVDG